MAKTGATEDTGQPLEAQLRNMILGNVQIGTAQPSAEPGWGGRRGGRGRGRAHEDHHHRHHHGPPHGHPHGHGHAPPDGERHHGLHNFRGRGAHRARGGAEVRATPRDQTTGDHFVAQGGRGYDPRTRSSPFVPLQRPVRVNQQQVADQARYLEQVAGFHLPHFEMSAEEFEMKNDFRLYLQGLLQNEVAKTYVPPPRVALEIFGSLNSGFAMPGSDMDLALLSEPEYPDIFRVFQRVLLTRGIGARLLTRTRVPILKICQRPSDELLQALRDDRDEWDQLTPEERIAHDTGTALEKDKPEEETPPTEGDFAHVSTVDGEKSTEAVDDKEAFDKRKPKTKKQRAKRALNAPGEPPATGSESKSTHQETQPLSSPEAAAPTISSDFIKTNPHDDTAEPTAQTPTPRKKPRTPKVWHRSKRLGPLDFPPDDIGIQCDINYANPLGIHNTHLLRCYSASDPRVRPMVLVIKGWASRRQINSSYNGTLSSYGYVLMVLHYLVNIASPPVCPNLQLLHPGVAAASPPSPTDLSMGADVRFWRAPVPASANTDPLGALLRGFFAYYAAAPGAGGFAWTQQVLALRRRGGVVTKAAKGWTGARTVDVAGKEVRNRYLVAIEDPFETEHNVARTVTHHGIVAIRDEFRRAWRLMGEAGRGVAGEDLMERVVDVQPEPGEGGSAETEGDGHGEGSVQDGLVAPAAAAETDGVVQKEAQG